MTFRIARLAQLSGDDLAAWSALQSASPRHASVFFRPELAKVVDGVCGDVEVAVVQQHGTPVAYFPFQRKSGSAGWPLLACLSDVQGIVAAERIEWDPRALLAAAGLDVLYFDHLHDDGSPLTSFASRKDRAWHVDLSRGFDSYLAERKAAGSQLLARCGQKTRKLQREAGCVEFCWHDADPAVVGTLAGWKSDQLRRACLPNVFRERWTLDLLERLQQSTPESCQGVVSTLRVAGELAAIHFGLRSSGVLTSWIPGFSPLWARYSPGLILHLRVLEEASRRGVERVDLGRGRNQLKLSLANGETLQGMGAVDTQPWRCWIRSAWYSARDVAHSGVLGQFPLHTVRRLRTWLRRGGSQRFESIAAML